MSSPERAPISEAAAPAPSTVPSAAPAPDTKETPRPLPSRVLLVRHGESTWNAERRVQGQHDPPLSEFGRRQGGRGGQNPRGVGARVSGGVGGLVPEAVLGPGAERRGRRAFRAPGS